MLRQKIKRKSEWVFELEIMISLQLTYQLLNT